MTHIGEYPTQVARFLTSEAGRSTSPEVARALLDTVDLVREDFGLDAKRAGVTQLEIERLSALLAELKGRALPHLRKCSVERPANDQTSPPRTLQLQAFAAG